MGAALDLVFPPRCVSCNRFAPLICDGCLATVTRADPPRCLVCWMPIREPAGEPLTAVPLAPRALMRPRSASPQYRLSDRDERRRNVSGAFRSGKRVPQGGVLLVDDVITTGATLDACARVLIGAGAGPVFALTFARED